MWHHAVIIYNGTTVKYYYDGILIDTHTKTALSLPSSGNHITIGEYRYNGSHHFEGYLDQIRIFNREITASEVATIYAETTTTASSINPLNEGQGVALYTLDFDSSESGDLFNGTSSNVTFGVGGNINYGARFNGSSSNISFPAILSSAYTGSVSASVWFKTTENSTDIKTIINSSDTFSGTSPKGFALFTESGVLRFVKWNISGTSASNGTTNIIDGNWHNAIIVLDNPNGTLKLYLDGETTTPEVSFSITANQTYNKNICRHLVFSTTRCNFNKVF